MSVCAAGVEKKPTTARGFGVTENGSNRAKYMHSVDEVSGAKANIGLRNVFQ